jgi:hypothetical protein
LARIDVKLAVEDSDTLYSDLMVLKISSRRSERTSECIP